MSKFLTIFFLSYLFVMCIFVFLLHSNLPLFILLFFTFFCVFFFQVCFATLDPPDPPVPGNVGHWCVVALNIKEKRFELLDSLRSENNPDAQRVFYTMTAGIKKLWREATNSKGESYYPKSIDNWEMHYVNVPKQLTALVYSLQFFYFYFSYVNIFFKF